MVQTGGVWLCLRLRSYWWRSWRQPSRCILFYQIFNLLRLLRPFIYLYVIYLSVMCILHVFGTAQTHFPIPIKGVTVASPFLHLPAMLFFIFIYYLVQAAFIDAGPTPSIKICSLDTNHCMDLTHCWTIWNIVWSCIVTIFLCTLMFHAWRSRTQLYHLLSITFLCLFVCCLCQSTFWHGL